MQNFTFYNPTKILFGKGQIAKIGKETKAFGTKALLVYGTGSIKKNGIYDTVVSSLTNAGIEIVDFPGARSNPVLSHAVAGIELARKEGVDVIVAVGGGSVIDTAKTIAVGAKTDGDVWKFFTREAVISDALPILTVVTISASASEMNMAAVITKEQGAQKFSIRSPHIQPKTSVLDPTLLFTLTPQYTAYSSVDIITHMLEGYFNNTEPDSILQDRMVEALIRTVMESTETLLTERDHYNARANIMWAATLGFNGLTTAGMGAVALPAHMIEHSLSALYDVPHGAGLSIVLPAWMMYVHEKRPAKFARFARRIFHVEKSTEIETARNGIERLKQWFASIGSYTSLADADIPDSDIAKIADNALALAKAWGLEDYTLVVIAEILKLGR